LRNKDENEMVITRTHAMTMHGHSNEIKVRSRADPLLGCADNS
jgi:hypothetical protein